MSKNVPTATAMKRTTRNMNEIDGAPRVRGGDPKLEILSQ
jgi:hypothetical protein